MVARTVPVPPLAEAKETVLSAIAAGKTVSQAMASVGRTTKTMENWRAKDRDFARRVDEVREARQAKRNTTEVVEVRPSRNLDFAAFRKQYLDRDTFAHQQMWVDVLEGRDPEVIPGTSWDKRDPDRLIVNVPPEHSKTQTLTVDYVTYRICMDPNVRVIIISKRQEQARKSLHQIKTRLISPRFAKLQAAFAPEGGFRPANGEGTFSANTIYVAGIERDQQDPTVEVLGIGAQIYGARADLIIMDDCVVLSNAHEYEKQIEWVESEVENRLVAQGKLLIIGTRLAQTDLYRELRNDRRYEISGRSPWSYLRQPYVLQFAENPEDWVTLWPKSTTPMSSSDKEIPGEPGWYWAKPGTVANKVRNSKPARVWSLVYMQQESASNATFTPEMIAAATNRFRKKGPLPIGSPKACPPTGMEGMYVIAGMDPFGEAAICVMAVERATHKRWVLDVITEPGATNPWVHAQIRQVTEQYGVHEWVIESNAAQAWITQDLSILNYLNQRGAKMTPHQTRGQNKYSEDIGIGAMAPLFGTFRYSDAKAGMGVPIPNGDHLIELPDPMSSPGIQTLIEELGTWQPGMKGRDLRMDAVMALWFCNIRAQHLLGFTNPGDKPQQHFVNNRFVSRRRSQQRFVAPAHVFETGGGW